MFNVEIEEAHTCKYLGVYLDDQLNWKHHIDYIYEKLVKFTGIFYRLRSKISSEWLTNIYYYFAYAHLLYGIEMYPNTTCVKLLIYTVFKKTCDHVFDDKLNKNCPFTKIFGTHINKSISHRQVFLVSHLTYFVQLLYVGNLSRPKYVKCKNCHHIILLTYYSTYAL